MAVCLVVRELLVGEVVVVVAIVAIQGLGLLGGGRGTTVAGLSRESMKRRRGRGAGWLGFFLFFLLSVTDIRIGICFLARTR